jgi:putative transposase
LKLNLLNETTNASTHKAEKLSVKDGLEAHHLGVVGSNRRLIMLMLRRTYKFRLYPTKAQIAALEFQLSECCRLYNAALQERREAYALEKKSIKLYDQTYQLKEIFADGDSQILGFSTAWYVLDRVDKAFKAFFKRVRERKGRAGFPRFKSFRRFDSFEWQANDNAITKGGKLRVQKMGEFKIKLHREIEGTVKHASVKSEAGKWYACLSAEVKAAPLPASLAEVGLDVGLSAFATLSDGAEINNPRYYKEAQAKFRRAQRSVSRRKRGGNGRRKAILLLQRAHAYVRNQRSDFHHKVSRWIVDGNGLIAVEDLNIKGLASGMLAKSITDAGWGYFLTMIAYKAESAGRVFVRVDPRGTSQRCVCGAEVRKELKDRRHDCSACGLSVSRDHASAMEILRLGKSLAALTCPATECVAAEESSP